MRDDIHKRVPVPPHWQRLVKRALTPADRGIEADSCLSGNILTDFDRELGVACLRKIENFVANHQRGLLRSLPIQATPDSLGIETTPLACQLLERVSLSSTTERQRPRFVAEMAKAVIGSHVQSHCREALATVAAARGSNVSETLRELARLQRSAPIAISRLIDRRISGERLREIIPGRRVDMEEDLRG